MIDRVIAILFLSLSFGCKAEIIPDEAQIFVVQEIKLTNGASFFWFRNDQQITHEGLSYFQTAKNKCDLSVEKANAYCEMPVQVLAVKKDTISILTQSEIVLINKPVGYTFQSIGYANDLYDMDKRPGKDGQYVLSKVCD